MDNYNSLQIREIFHLEFLRWFSKKVKIQHYVLKGGVNLRFFFKNIRYSEDLDIDVSGIGVSQLKEIVMGLLQLPSFKRGLEAFGVKEILPPNILNAKQTETTQRLKVYLITFSGEDLFTKVEFSRRGLTGKIKVETVSKDILRFYKMPPLLVAHYTAGSAVAQKIQALAARNVLQPRDTFDLYILTTQLGPEDFLYLKAISTSLLKKAYENIFELSFEQFKSTVVSYLSAEDQFVYSGSSTWEEIRLKTADFVEELIKKNG